MAGRRYQHMVVLLLLIMTRRWTDQQFIEAVASSITIKDVIIKIQGKFTSGGNYKMVHHHVKRLNLDTSHWRSREAASAPLHKQRQSKQYTEADLILNSRARGSHFARFLIKNAIIPYVCVECANTGTHNNRPLRLQLDHKNGNNTDNRITNLRFLCPNCHSQTPTYARIK